MAVSNLNRQRHKLLRRLEQLLETPMIVLGFIWLVLVIVELLYGLNPFLEKTGILLWVVFIADFVIKFWIAPSKIPFLKSNILTIISLFVPAFRVFRIFRVLRVLRFTRSLRLVKVIGSLNRSLRAIGATMKRRAFGYVITITAVVLFAGAAGMYAFEKDHGLADYATALWWTMMLLTTMGSEYWPQTPEGRILCIILAIYAFAVFGYVTATIATYFIGRDAESPGGEVAGRREINELKREIQVLQELLRRKT